MKYLIIGAGSIGNHLTRAARAGNHSVLVCDKDSEALRRMKEDIYPSRYGVWDEKIQTVLIEDVLPDGEFDVICIGTPPDSHLKLALKSINKRPKILHIEKPLFAPTDSFEDFEEVCKDFPEVMVTVGYDHAVAPSVLHACRILLGEELGKVRGIHSQTLEHWEGIFGAHPWLAGPHDSYLGYWERGGGALSEHSHALHLGIVLAEIVGWEPLSLISAYQSRVSGVRGENYDSLSSLALSPGGSQRVLTVTQDVVTKPTQKFFRVVGEKGMLEVSLSGNLDVVTQYRETGEKEVKEFPKTRPDDFLALMGHYENLVSGQATYETSPIHIRTGLAVMRIIREAFARTNSPL